MLEIEEADNISLDFMNKGIFHHFEEFNFGSESFNMFIFIANFVYRIMSSE